MSDLVERLRALEAFETELAHDGDCPPEATANWKHAETCREAAARIEQLEAALEVCDRVLHFDLRGMITWGKDYNQAVKDAADAARAALGDKS